MLQALRQWRDKSSTTSQQAIVESESASGVSADDLPREVVDSGWMGHDQLMEGEAEEPESSASALQAEPEPVPESLEVCPPVKSQFFATLAETIEREPEDEKIFREVEAYFLRHAGPIMLAQWEWESIEAGEFQCSDETLRSIIRRSMTEAGVRLVGIVLENQAVVSEPARLRRFIERAEWSIRRGDQTLLQTGEEVLAPYRPGSSEALTHE